MLGAGLLIGCGASTTGGSTGTQTDPLNFTNTNVPAAFVGEDYTANLQVSGGVGPYAYRLTSGSLPSGMQFSGGVLSGKPTVKGTYKFTVEANDANLSNKVVSYTLNVGDLPPVSLEPSLPSGEVRGETRIPVLIKAPRGVRAARLIWDLGKDVQITRVQAADNSSPVFWKQSAGILTVDLGFRTIPRSGARVALISIKPLRPTTLSASTFWYESRDGKGLLLSENKPPAPAPAASPANSVTPSPTAPGTGAPNTPVPSTPAPNTPASNSPAPANPTDGTK